MALAVVDQILKLHRAQIKGLIQVRGIKKVRSLYDQARMDCEAKLAALKKAGKDQTFTAHHTRQVLVQVRDGVKSFQKTLQGHVKQQGQLASTLSQRHTISAIKSLESHFSGTTPVLQVEQAAVFRRVYAGVEPALLNHYAASISNYGLPLIKKVRDNLALSIIENDTVDEAVDKIVAEDGIFSQDRWRAERIVRTEMSYSYGVTNQFTMEEIAVDIPDLQKKLIATFDDRTGDDSKELHGQVVAIDQPFVWEKYTKKNGIEIIEYMQPPNRPNDREVVIPWRSDWTDSKWSAPTGEDTGPPDPIAQVPRNVDTPIGDAEEDA